MRMQGYSPKEFVTILMSCGWELSHKNGTHHTYANPNNNRIITVPMSRKEICRPLAKRLMKQAGII